MRKWLVANREIIATVSPLVSTVVQVIAVCIAGYWTYHVYSETGEWAETLNVTVSAEVLPYDNTQRLLIVHMRPKNVGKVPIIYHPTEDMRITVKVLPDKIPEGLVDVDKLPAKFHTKNLFANPNYGEAYELYPGIEFHESAAFVVPPGKYYVEGEIEDKKEGETIGDQTFVEVK